mmetsp:Transcript_18492/g.23812  ORF Transcript_18492/g.23812 Transcript_18492/m.23812 type:complete len:567 (+) Transcript_18492:189-1889(+)|eukprot:CAMPEP_0198146784 /NCGR_PEP_ID=MMETSP1443-20131203/31393_1 /TAXON_ID=186043 /ORGANISM="Entomoneis sp., Strain CCMP2396" /LENGTH=566 /DNA_ID=CAMNT_0043810861 /DNA_START=103 /DNA_END=1803 /DNA_ORIENTATION=-
MAETKTTPIDYRLLTPQILIGLVDAMSYMVVSPSIVFYILESGGTYEQYGIILSVFSFASFVFKPVLGYWCDASGGTYRKPYLTSIAIAIVGGMLYFCASIFVTTETTEGESTASSDGMTTAIVLIFLGRLLGGMGAANQTLGFAYIAQVIDKENLTKASAVLSMVRVFGMVVAPGLNVFLNNVDTEIHLGGTTVKLTPLNSVGLLLVGGNLLGFLAIYFLLEEPPTKIAKPQQRSSVIEKGDDNDKSNSISNMVSALASLDIFIPLLSVFTLNANFQLMETGLAPAANDALGWGPVQISALFGANAIMIFLAIVLTFSLSSRGVTDESLLTTGLVFSIAGYTLMYLLWENPTNVVLFAIPIAISTMAFPFMGAPTRSIFTRVVDSKPQIAHLQGTMQALMSMCASIAGFTAPGLISAFILRRPEEVAVSSDHRELTAWALFAPILSTVTLVGLLYLRYKTTAATTTTTAEEEDLTLPDETTGLLDTTTEERGDEETEPAFGRHTVTTFMGIPWQLNPAPTIKTAIAQSHRHSTIGIIGLRAGFGGAKGMMQDDDVSSGRRQSTFF